jgi:hypothetical protein
MRLLFPLPEPEAQRGSIQADYIVDCEPDETNVQEKASTSSFCQNSFSNLFER